MKYYPLNRAKDINFFSQSGLTMIELLVILVIVSFITIAGFAGYQTSAARGRDAQRKADLDKIMQAFESYYNNNDCYPDSDVLDSCGATTLAPYLNRVPCDPMGNTYLYTPLADQCDGYRLHTGLEVEQDTAIQEVGCNLTQGCGIDADYNWGIAVGATVFDPNGAAASP